MTDIAKLKPFKGEAGSPVVITDRAPQGSTILAGPFPTTDHARVAYVLYQRRLVMAEGEEIRIHAPNGGYLFSVRFDSTQGPVIAFDRTFTQQPHDYATPVRLYPWNKEAK